MNHCSFRLCLILTGLSLHALCQAQDVESVASIRAIEAPNALKFAGLDHSTDGFGSEILPQGLDALFVMQDDGYAAHYSTQKGAFTNFLARFNVPGAPTQRFRYHYAPDAIYRIGGDVFDRIDRDTGRIASLDNPLGNPFEIVGLGDTLVALSDMGIAGYRASSGDLDLIYSVSASEPNNNERFLTMERDGDRIYALKRRSSGSFYSSDVADTWLECYDLRTGARLYRQQVELAFLSDNTYGYRSIVPFDVGFGVVAIGGVGEVRLYEAADGSLIGTMVGATRRSTGGPGLVDATYYTATTKNSTQFDSFSGNLLVGNNRLYIQNDNASGSTADAPGVSVFDFDFNHLYDIPNGYRSIGVTEANDFGGEMALVGERLLIGSRRFYRAASDGYRINVADPLVFEVQFTAPDGTFPEQVEAIYSEGAYRVSENADLEVTVELSAGSTEEVRVRVTPDFLTSFETETPATAVDDFPTGSQTATFAPGETSKTLVFPIVDDVDVEDPETFQLIMNRETSNVSVASALRRVTILSDDFEPTSDLVRIGRLDVGDREPGEAISEIAASDALVAVGLPGADKVLLYDPFTLDYLGEVSSASGSTDSFGLSLDVFEDTVVIGEPGADSDAGEITIVRVDQSGASPVVSILDRITEPSIGVGTVDFGRRVRIHGDHIAAAGEVETNPSGSDERVFIYEETSPGVFSRKAIIANPDPANPNDNREEDRYFASAFDLNDNYLVVANPLTRYRLVTNNGNSSLLPEEGRAYVYDLGNLSGAPVEISGDAGFGAEGVAVGTNDFVIVDSDEAIIGSGYDGRNVLYRYDFAGNELNREDRTDGLANSQALADLVYNDEVAMRSNDQTRQVQATFSADDSQATYQFGEPVRSVSAFRSYLYSISRGGFDRDNATSYVYLAPIPSGGATPLTSDALNAAINADHFFTIDRGETDFPAVFQLPNTVAVRAIPGTLNEAATPAASEGPVTFELNTAAAEDVTLRFSTLSETAQVDDGTVGADVLTQGGEVTIPAGQTSATAIIALAVDDTFEGDETFQVVVESVRNATIQDRVATITIIDDETELDLPVVSIDSTSFTESDIFTGQVSAGQLPVNDAELTVTLSASSAEDVVVFYDVSSNDASFARELRQLGFESIEEPGRFSPDYTVPRYGRDLNGDFSPDTGVLRPRFAYKALIPAGQTSATIEIPIANDAIAESSEQIQVELVGAVGARVGANNIGLISILDDDSSEPVGLSFGAPGFSISGHTVAASDGKLAVGAEQSEITVSDFDGSNAVTIAAPRGNNNNAFGDVVAIGEGYVVGADVDFGSFPPQHWAYLFDTAGNQIAELIPDTAFGNFIGPDYGSDAAIAASGGTTGVLVGAGDSKQVFVFDASDQSELRVLSEPSGGFGSQVSASGSQVLASTFGSGAYLYDWTDGSLVHHFDSTGFDGANFGGTVHLTGDDVIIGSGDGSVAGAGNSDGVIAVFDRTTFQERYVLVPGSGDSGFGDAVAVAGGVLAVGSDAGVNLYRLSDGGYLDTLDINWYSLAGNDQTLFISDVTNGTVIRYSVPDLLAAGQSGFGGFLGATQTIVIDQRELLPRSNLPALVGYALGLEGDDPDDAAERRLQLDLSIGEPRIRLRTPERLPENIRLEVFESTDLGAPWNCIGVKEGSRPWQLMRPGSVLPLGDDSLEELQIRPEPSTTPSSFYYMEASEL